MKYFLFAFILLTVPTYSGFAQDTVQVISGWNLIGSVKDGAVPDVLSTTPDSLITSSYFGYTPDVGYQSTDTLGKGLGYWVKAKDDGIIVFNTTPVVDSCKSKAFIYQGKFYNTVKIGDQCWMAENLDVGTMVDSLANQTDNDTTEKYCYNNDPLHCALYGGLYQWDEAMQYSTTPGARGICPTGWHLPTFEEYQALSSTVGGEGNALKVAGVGAGSGVGTNASGFSSLLAGRRNTTGAFTSRGVISYFWRSTQVGAEYAYYMALNSATGTIFLGYDSKSFGFSVRCIAD
jgi:uncharacterized protein (TIGR02145 family)